MPNVVKLTHANVKNPDTGKLEAVTADLDLISFWYHSPGSRATHLVANGGAIMPVVESVEYITSLKEGKRNYEQ